MPKPKLQTIEWYKTTTRPEHGQMCLLDCGYERKKKIKDICVGRFDSSIDEFRNPDTFEPIFSVNEWGIFA